MGRPMNYQEFLAEKVAIAKSTGLEIDDSEIHPILKPHQRDIVKFCVNGGCRAIFAAFGLGKTLIQLESLRLIKQKSSCEALIVCPLGVRQEFKRDAALIGLETAFIRSNREMEIHQLQNTSILRPITTLDTTRTMLNSGSKWISSLRICFGF